MQCYSLLRVHTKFIIFLSSLITEKLKMRFDKIIKATRLHQTLSMTHNNHRSNTAKLHFLLHLKHICRMFFVSTHLQNILFRFKRREMISAHRYIRFFIEHSETDPERSERAQSVFKTFAYESNGDNRRREIGRALDRRVNKHSARQCQQRVMTLS